MGRSQTERAIVIHSLAHARAAVAVAVELGVPVTLLSAAGAAAYTGPLWFAEVVAHAAAGQPGARISAILDCGDAPGLVLAALRAGLTRVRFTGRRGVAAKLAVIARRQGAEVVGGRLTSLDLLDLPDPAAACRRWLTAR